MELYASGPRTEHEFSATWRGTNHDILSDGERIGRQLDT
jgi:hypothetical protein